MTMQLYDFFRSGTSHRLRIALNFKGLTYETLPVDLRTEEHLTAAYAAIHPQRLLPALNVDGTILIQSPAILEWLEECYPEPPLLPAEAADRAIVRSLAAMIGCDIHPVNNRRILQMLRTRFGADEAAVREWCRHWIGLGFDGLVDWMQARGRSGSFSFGMHPTLADVYLVPQMESARRFDVDLARWPRLLEIEAACLAIDAFRNAAPRHG